MKRLLSLSLIGILVLAMAGAATAHGNRFHGPNLTPEQAEKMKQLSMESHAAISPIMQQFHAKRAELKAQIYNPNPDMGKIEALAKELGELKGKLYAERAGLHVRLSKEGLPARSAMRHDGCPKRGMGRDGHDKDKGRMGRR